MQQDQSQQVSVLGSVTTKAAHLPERLDIVDIVNGRDISQQINHGANNYNNRDLDSTILDLNNEGIALFEESCYSEAVQCFRNALHRLETGQPSSLHNTDTNTGATKSTITLPSTHYIDGNGNNNDSYSAIKPQSAAVTDLEISSSFQKQQQKPRMQRQSIPGLSSLPLSLSVKTSEEKPCKRNEYDEGMNVFPSPLPLDICNLLLLQQQRQHPEMKTIATDRHTTSRIILLYNIGQGLVRFRKTNAEAIDCFNQALFLAQKDDSSNTLPSSATSESTLLDSKTRACSHCYHVLPFQILHNIGFLQYRNEHYREAIQTFGEALQYCRCRNQQQQRRQQQHRYAATAESKLDMAATLNCLGVLYMYVDADTAKSLDYLLTAFAMRVESLGHQENRNMATNLNNIGRVYYMQGQYDDALRFYETALRIRRNILGNSSLDVAVTISNAGQTLHCRGKLDQAMVYYQEFLQIAIPLLGATHYDVALMYRRMAQIYHERKEYESAISFYEKALIAVRENLGVDNEEVASILNKMGNLFYQTDNLTDALRMYQEGLLVERKVFHGCHPHISVTLSNIAVIYKQRAEYTNALEVYKEALAIQKVQSCGKSNPTVAITLSNMGLIHYENENYEEALELYQEALHIRRDVFGEEPNLEVASSLNSIGLVFFKLVLHKKAIQFFIESLHFKRSLLGPNHRDVTIITFNIATIYVELGNDDEALKFYLETLRIERQVVGPYDVILTLKRISQLHQQRGEVNEVLNCYNEILQIQRNNYREIISGNTSDVAAPHTPHNKISQTSVTNTNDDNTIMKKDDMMKRKINITEIARTLQTMANIYLQIGNAEKVVQVMSEAVRVLRDSGRSEDDILNLNGFYLYSIAKLHPECSAAA